MPEFLNPFAGVGPDHRLTDHELSRAVRHALSAEQEGVHLCEALADHTDNVLARTALQDIANEERVHAREFLPLLGLLLADEDARMKEGADEVDALALAPALYNKLFRRYPEGNMTELEHFGQVVPGGIVKAAAIPRGGVLVTSVKELAALVVGQDLVASYVGPSGRDYAFAISETLALRLTEPASICVLR